VPVVTCIGRTPTSRGGYSLSMNLGSPELVGRSDDEFVDIVVELARDLPRLRNLRADLRQRMKASPLMDGARFERGIENAYREAWRDWCGAQAARTPTAERST
jgi:protein O-GlcNAc transferase